MPAKILTITASLLVCLASASFAAAPLTDFVAAAEHLHLAADVAPVSNLTFSVGHMAIKLTSGSAARVLAGNEPVGIFFKGNGSFQYEDVDIADVPVVNHNVKAVAHVKLVSDAAHAVISDDFTEVLLVGGGVAWPELTGSGGAALADAFKAHDDLFARVYGITPRAHLLAVQKFSGAKMVQAEIAGGHDTLLYGIDRDDEALMSLRPSRSIDRVLKDRFYPDLLSEQPVGHDRATAAKPPFALDAIDYVLTADGDNAKVEVTETIRPLAPAGVLEFSLLSEIIERRIRGLNLRSVTDDQGRALPFHHDRNDLLVSTEGINAPAFKLKFAIDGDFIVRDGGDNAWQLRVGEPWYPMPQSLAGMGYTVHSLVKVKKPFIPIAPGKTVTRTTDGDFNVVENVIDRPVTFTVVQAGKYTIFEDKSSPNRVVRVATYGLPNQTAAKQLSGMANGIIDYYEYFLGPFPWSEFNIVQINTYGYGQAPPGTMHITNEAFNPHKGSEDDESVSAEQLFSEGINERFAHEIAHQYWGHVVREPSREEQWLSESFAEYSAALALKKLQGDSVYNRMVAKWKGRAKDGVSVAPIPYANRIEGDPRMSFVQRSALLYAKGPYLLYTLNKDVGDTAFLTFLKSYTKTFNGKMGTTKDVAGLLGFITKKDFKPFFEQYYWGTAMP